MRHAFSFTYALDLKAEAFFYTFQTLSSLLMSVKSFFHVLLLSNFARGFDKYRRSYDKSSIRESTYPDRFFVLEEKDLSIGTEKVNRLLNKLNLWGDSLIAIESLLDSDELHPNARNGKGLFRWGDSIPVTRLWTLNGATLDSVLSVENAYAQSLALLHPQLKPYSELQPRTFSILPIARACQAKCKFCYSESSVSIEQFPRREKISLDVLEEWCRLAKAKGAERFVITGGGEPGLLKHFDLLNLIRIGAKHFHKVVLISNGVHLSSISHDVRLDRLNEYADSGLTTLAISRHHYDTDINREIMGLDTKTEEIAKSLHLSNSSLRTLKGRFICVLQKNGIDSFSKIKSYLDWAVSLGITEICFKELYVASTEESIYHTGREHQWCQQHQVSLSLVTEFCASIGFAITSNLPWGAPVFDGYWNGQRISIAAYTEPNVFWERHTGIARSWNLMADGTCLTSLEDPLSTIYNRVTPPIFHLKQVS